MGGKGFSTKLKAYTEKNYKDSKTDLFAVFIERCNEFTKQNCYTSMITMQSWMFLSSFESLRKNIIEKTEIKSLLQLGYGVIGIAFGTTAFNLKKSLPAENRGNYFRMFDKIAQNIKTEDCATLFRIAKSNDSFRYKFDEYSSENKISETIESNEKGNLIKFQTKQKDFEKIPGSPIAYWVSDKVREIFEKNQKLGEVGKSIQGMSSADNNRFLRLWNEVNYSKIGYNIANSEEALESKKKWFPYNKGGEFRKWYGNQEYLVNWENDGYEIKNFKKAVLKRPTKNE